VKVENRPGLSAVAYRVATHADFAHQMRDGLSDSRRPSLGRLTTREEDDFSIALLDAWATVGDVLTFYQERIANESYLRTATERLSIRELARLIGYELRPGVAASTHLAFTLDSAVGAPQQTTIDAGVKVQSIPGPGQAPQTFETVESIQARVEWNAIRPSQTEPQTLTIDAKTLYLSGTALNLARGDRIVIVVGIKNGACVLRRVEGVEVDVAANYTTVTLDGSGSPIETKTDIPPGAWILRVKAAAFGHNAAREQTTIVDGKVQLKYWDFEENLTILTLDAVYERIHQGSYVVVDAPMALRLFKASTVRTISRAAYGIAARVTELSLNGQWFEITTLGAIRETSVFAEAELLQLAEEPLGDAIEANGIRLKGSQKNLIGRTVAFSGAVFDLDEPASEIAHVSEAEEDKGETILWLEQDLQRKFKRSSVVINANVARATHGETDQEVLGSGDATQAHQEFTLRQTPLTYTSAPTPTGAASTLQVRANDQLWHEVPTLYGRDPAERVFVTRRDDQGRTTIRFGGRLPTGQENVKATYRKGIGAGGLVDANQLTLLMTRPLGVRAVTNPLPATGAGDPAALEDSRRQAPMTVMTLDRVVSLRDYEDFARAYAGIAKALATWSQDGAGRTVFLTIAGPKGAPVGVGSDLEKNLLAALRDAGDPHIRVRTGIYNPTFFRLAGRIWIDRDASADAVSASVAQSLRTRFSFDARDFGQSVALSEVMSAIHAVPGVMAADIDALYRTQDGIALNHRLPAAVSGPAADGTTASAELLTLDAAPVDLVLEPLP
jgi:predicted phage baseplate assembly protein